MTIRRKRPREMWAAKFFEQPGMPKIPLGFLTPINGPTSTNKSMLASLIMARATMVGMRIAVFSIEDPYGNRYGPMLRAAGADMGRVVVPTFRPKLPRDTKTLRTWLTRQRIDIVTLDLAIHFKERRFTDFDAYLSLMDYLTETEKAALLPCHTNKTWNPKRHAIDALPGPPGETLGGLAKSVLVIARDRDDPLFTRHVGYSKWNFGLPPDSLSYGIEEQDLPPDPPDQNDWIHEVGHLDYRGACPLNANQILRQGFEQPDDQPESDATERSMAAAWLCDLLGDGAAHPRDEIEEQAKQELPDTSFRTIQRAAQGLGIDTNERDPDDRRRRLWQLPTGLLFELRRQDDPDAPDEGDDWPTPA